MAYSGFENKSEPEHKARFSWFNLLPKAVGRRLGFRVFFVALIFLVVPLVIHGWVSYLEDYYFRKKVLFLGLTSLASGKTRFAEQMIQDKANIADVIGVMIGKQSLPRPVESFNDLFEEIVQEQNTNSIFFQQLQPSGQFICDLAADPRLIGKQDLFAQDQKLAITDGQSVFFGVDPLRASKEIYISKAVHASNPHDPIGTVTIGVDAMALLNWVALITTAPFPFQLSLLDQNSEVFVSQGELFNIQNAWLFCVDPTYQAEGLFQQIAATEDGKAYLSVLGKNKDWLGIKIAIPGTPFFLMASASLEMISIKPSSELVDQLVHVALIFLVIGGGLALLITIRVSRPLNALYNVMQQVEKGNLLARYHQDKMGFEINVLGLTFNRMIEAVIHHGEEARNERVARELLSNELKIGHDIQRSILPKKKPDFPGVAIATGFQGAKEVAGDFYDIFMTKEKQLVCSIADAAGKGISACLYSLLVRSMFRSLASTSDQLPQMVQKTNELFCLDTADTGNFVTAWVGFLESETKRLHYTSCGHLPAILKRKDGTIEELTTPGMALGVDDSFKVYTSYVQLNPGDLLLLYTDGIIDSQNSYFDFFGKGRLMQIVEREAIKTAEQLVDAIFEGVAVFSQGTPLSDDRTLLAVQIV